MGDLDRLASEYRRPRSAHLAQGQHFYAGLDFSQHRQRHWNGPSICCYGSRNPGGIVQQEYGRRYDHVRLRPCIRSNPRGGMLYFLILWL
jgi:hypothetical protein